MAKQANRLGLPVIKVPHASTLLNAENKVWFNETQTNVHIDDVRFMLDETKQKFRKIDGEYGFCISPDDLDKIVKVLEEADIDPIKIRKIKEGCLQADYERKKGKAIFDEEGKFSSIRKNTGYNEDEKQYIITHYGYSEIRNVHQDAKETRKMMLNGGRGVIASSNKLTIPFSEIEQMIHEAQEGLSADQLENLQHWAVTALPKLKAESESQQKLSIFGTLNLSHFNFS